MTGGDLTIVIAGTREDGPGGGEDPDPARVPPGNRTGSGLSSPARPRSPPGQRPHRLDHAGPPARSPDINRFEVRISAPGDGWLERLGWRRWIPSRPPLPRPSSRRAMPAQGPAHSPGSPTIAKRPDRSPAVSRAKLHCKGLGGAGRRARRRTAARNRPRRPPEGPWSPAPRESSESLFSVNYFCRLASTIFAGSGRRESRSTTMTPVGRVGVACDVQSGVENALPRRCRVAPLLARVFHAAGAVHRLLGFRSIPAFRRSTVGGRGAAADPEHVPGEQAPRGISGGTGPCGSSGRRTQACSA